MRYTELTRKAMNIAYEAHAGQLDRGGVPYIFHPMHLSEQMGDDEYAICVALLHDVVEDTDWTLQQLAQAFPREVVEAVALLTHDPREPYMAYVKKIRGNALARRVKLADLKHNSDLSRIDQAQWQEAKTKARLEKYLKAWNYLMEDDD